MNNIKILLLEDEPLIQDLYFNILTNHGFDVIQFYDVSSAETYYLKHNLEIDIIITDMTLTRPDDGFVFISKYYNLNPNVKIIVISGFISNDVIRNALITQYKCEILEKPFNINELLFVIKN